MMRLYQHQFFPYRNTHLGATFCCNVIFLTYLFFFRHLSYLCCWLRTATGWNMAGAARWTHSDSANKHFKAMLYLVFFQTHTHIHTYENGVAAKAWLTAFHFHASTCLTFCLVMLFTFDRSYENTCLSLLGDSKEMYFQRKCMFVL